MYHGTWSVRRLIRESSSWFACVGGGSRGPPIKDETSSCYTYGRGHNW